MADIAVEKRFSVLCQITRSQHFAWRRAVCEVAPEVDPEAVVQRMWEVTGHQTGDAYLKRIDTSKPLSGQIARSIAWSSQCMGEDAQATVGDGAADEAWVRHEDCPWVHWHRREGLLAEDRPGCDAWFQSTVDHVNTTLGTRLKVETLEALPDGGSCCLRRLWVEPNDG
jgi:hypothetical protein